ncbi:coiled-coil domain-containing protein 27 [Tenrec ecaudatus]|uniref:coiled-coil domain-containing protein 27 n=1 Tax=Tenrec ecaudatus TaxID=94439 RepID=UPI003F5997FB
MLPTKEVSPAKRDNAPNTLAKGLASLHCVARRVSKTPEGRCSFHKPKLVLSRSKLKGVKAGVAGEREPQVSSFMEFSQGIRCLGATRPLAGQLSLAGAADTKEVLDGDTPPSFTSQVEDLRRAFHKRPGCPRFSTRATSMSQYGLSVVAALPRELDVNTEMTEDFSSQQGSDSNMDESLLSFSKSACEFNYLRKRSKSQTTSAVVSSPTTVQSPPKKKMPWYISVIHEKDNCLFMLSEEVQRLSELEVQSRRKDEELLILREERETLRRQLKYLFKGKVWETPVSPGLQDGGSPCQDRPGQYMTLEELQEQFEALKVRMGALQDRVLEMPPKSRQEDHLALEKGVEGDLEGEGGGGVGKEEDDLEGASEQAEGEEEEEGVVEEEPAQEVGDEEAQGRRRLSLDEAFEDELIARLEEYEQVVQEIQCDLEITRSRYLLATGAITSLQRQMDFHESQMQKMAMENELLQKELRERKNQLQAMSDKFSNLRESKKHEEMMGRIEKDNLLLRQHVMELEKELTERDHIISEYNTKVQELQSQVDQDQSHMQKQKELQDKLQSMRDQSRQAEQQSRVSLENAQARLERLRNRIIQATFSYSGVKSLVTEISDNDILEALQRVITERNDFYNQLKQKGMKIPSLNQMDGPYSSSSKSKRMTLNMQSQVSSVQYTQWKDSGQIEVKAVAEPDIQYSRCKRIYQAVCTAKGITTKILAGVALFWVIFTLGYVTGYFVHKCK